MEIQMPELIGQVLERIESAGHEAWLVGGCIRDHLLGKEPKDWDVATSADSAAIMEILKDAVRIVPVGVKFGTISLATKHTKGEVSSYRGANLAQDLARRDFTINAMAWHPHRGLEDPWSGQKDLAQAIIRCPNSPADIFRADALRMVRAVRFAAQLGFTVETETLKAIRDCHALIAETVPERIRQELSAILISPRPRAGIELMRETGLLAVVLPELQACVGFQQHNPHHNMDVYQHILAVVGNTPSDLVLRLAALFHDIGKPLCLSVDEKGIGHFYGHDREGAVLAGQIMSRLRYDNETIAAVKKLVRGHMLRINYPRMNPAKLLARVGRGNIENLFLLQEADAQAGVDRSVGAIAEMREKVEQALAEDRPYQRSDLKITGRDLLDLGVPPGAEVGRIMDRLVVAVLRSPRLNKKGKLLTMARDMLRGKEE